MGNSMSVSSRQRAKRALVSLCTSFLLLAFAASAGVQDARVLWVTLPGSVLRISPLDGSVAMQLTGLKQPGSLVVEGTNDTVWIYGQKDILGYDAQGNQLVSLVLPSNFHGGTPAGMAVDNAAGNIWIAIKKDLYRLDMGGNLKADIALPNNASGLSLDATDSTLWVAEQGGIQIFDVSGNAGLNLTLGANPPTAIAYDDSLKQAWVLFSASVERMDGSGTVVASAALTSGLSQFIAPDGRGGAWVAGQQNLAHLDTTGQAQFINQPFAGLSGGNTLALVVDPLDRSAWVANTLHLRQYASDGSFVHEAALPVGPGNGNGLNQVGLYVDTIPPTVSISSPTNGTYTNHNQPTLALVYSDIGSGVDSTSIAVTNSGTNIPVTCQTDSGGSGSSCIPTSPLTDGSYSLSITVKDYAGNVSQPATVSFTVDTVPPTITVASPSSAYTDQPALTVTGSLSEAGALSINGADVALSATYAFSQADTLKEGANPFTFVATDLAGNTSTVTKTITLDTIPPSVPNTGLITVTSTGNGQYTIVGTTGAIDPNTQVTITDPSTGQSVTVTSDSSGAFSATLAAQAGDKLTITATDEAGNTSSSELQLAAACGSNTGPGNTIIQPASAAVTITGPIGATLDFPLTRTGDLGFDALVGYQTVDGSALGGRDYVTSSGTFRVPAGNASAELPVAILGSAVNSQDKTMTLKIKGVSSGSSSVSLTPQQTYDQGTAVWYAAAVDLNGDGKPDIVDANINDSDVSVLVNTTPSGAANATFSAQQAFATGNDPSFVTAADINGDGKQDLIVVNSTDGTLGAY